MHEFHSRHSMPIRGATYSVHSGLADARLWIAAIRSMRNSDSIENPTAAGSGQPSRPSA